MIFHENRLLTEDSHEISYLIFFEKLGKMSQKLSSAAFVIGALKVNNERSRSKSYNYKYGNCSKIWSTIFLLFSNKMTSRLEFSKCLLQWQTGKTLIRLLL